MFGIGMPELIMIAVVALLVVGPKKLPDLAKTLGKGLNEFRKTASDVTDGLKDTIKADDIKKDVESMKNSLLYGGDKEEESSPAESVPPLETTKNEAPTADK
jgi:Tat protein translocase TatB subunit